MLEKWIYVFRHSINEAGLNEANYSDQEILTIAKGTFAPQLSKEAGIEKEWVFELYWQALLAMEPAEVLKSDGKGLINMDIFKQRVKRNTN